MDSSVANQKTNIQTVTTDEVNRLLEVGRLLFSVLTVEEIEALQIAFTTCHASDEIGNTGVS